MNFKGKQTTIGAGVFYSDDKGIPVDVVLNTDGSGYWSVEEKKVKVIGLCLSYTNDEQNYGELRVFFDTDSWDTMKYGLIYTDDKFIEELKTFLLSIGLGIDVFYSEQGMQGDNYVSFDVGEEFIKSFKSMV